MSRKLKVIILDDSSDDAGLVQHELAKAGFTLEAVVADDEDDYVRLLGEFKPNLIIADYWMPAFTAHKALTISQKLCPNVPFVVISGVINDKAVAAETLSGGAAGFVLKDELNKLPKLVGKVIR